VWVAWAVRGLEQLGQQAESLQAKREAELRSMGLVSAGAGHGGRVAGIGLYYQTRDEVEPHPHTAHLWQVEVPTISLSLASSGPASAQDKYLGDPKFHAQFRVRGGPTELAMLDSSVRARLLGLPGAWLQGGQLGCRMEHFDPRIVPYLLRVAQEMRAMPSDPVGRLQRGLLDPVAGVRLQTLASASRLDPQLGVALAQQARHDPDAVVRALASILLVDEGIEGALAVESLPLELRVWGSQVLLRVGRPEQRLRVGQALLGHPEVSLQNAGLELLRSLGSEGERALIEALSRVDGALLGQVAAALAAVGTAAAVPALRERQAELSLLQRGLSGILERAVLSIQERAGGTVGGLALASAAEQGAVSVAPARGALSPREPT
jgi:hypothetical protein